MKLPAGETISFDISAPLNEMIADCSLRAEIIAAIGSMDNYELTIAAAYIRNIIKTRGKKDGGL